MLGIYMMTMSVSLGNPPERSLGRAESDGGVVVIESTNGSGEWAREWAWQQLIAGWFHAGQRAGCICHIDVVQSLGVQW